MECICVQTRHPFILSSKRVLGNGVRTHVNSKGIISTGGSKQDRTRNAASRRTASPTHFILSYSGPSYQVLLYVCPVTAIGKITVAPSLGTSGCVHIRTEVVSDEPDCIRCQLESQLPMFSEVCFVQCLKSTNAAPCEPPTTLSVN